MTADNNAVNLRATVIKAVRSVKVTYPPRMPIVSDGEASRIADAVLAAIDTKEAAAKALEDAADAWQSGAWADAPRYVDPVKERVANGQFVLDWLRARAADVRQEGQQ